MSTNQNGVASRKRNGGKAVRFASDDDAEPSRGSSSSPAPRRKRPRLERPNEDEQDDVDDWIDDEEHVGVSTKDMLEAKRSRRLKRDHVDDENTVEETHVDATTSLIAESESDEKDVPIEPFNMDAERTDGSGYFEGDTYVFRNRDADKEEPDAWVDSLGDDGDQKLPAKEKSSEESSADGEDTMDDWSREDLYAKLIPLVSDTETVLQALIRYGELIKRKQANSMAQEALNSLTEASNALLLKGDVDIYQKTRKDLMKEAPEKDAVPKEKKQAVQWEYRGNQDGELHGPYTTEQMKAWTGAGYFVGEQAVQIRTVETNAISNDQKKPSVDDLLSDLMDDEDEKGETVKEERGEWMSSNDVNFDAYA